MHPWSFPACKSQPCLVLILFGGQGISLLATVSSKAYALGKVLLLLWWKQHEILASLLSAYFLFKSVSKPLPNGHFILKVAASPYGRFTNTLLSHGRPIFFLVVCFNLEWKAIQSENMSCFVYTPCAWLHNLHWGWPKHSSLFWWKKILFCDNPDLRERSKAPQKRQPDGSAGTIRDNKHEVSPMSQLPGGSEEA